MELQVRPLYTQIITSDADEFQAVRELCRYQQQGYERTYAYRRGSWDGYTNLFWQRRGAWCFPTGLLPRVLEVYPQARIIDLCGREPRPEVVNLLELEYRPYQFEAVNTALACGRGIIWTSTASGKTCIGAGIIRSLGVRTLWLTHEASLAEQTAAELRRLTGLPVRTYRGRWVIPREDILVGSVRSLHLHLGQAASWLQTVRLLVIDECHITSAAGVWKVAMNCPAPWRFGLSGTALERSDGADLRTVAALGPVIVRKAAVDLQDYLAPLKVIMSRVPGRIVSRYVEYLQRARLRGADEYAAETEARRAAWTVAYQDGVVRYRPRNDAIIAAVQEGVRLDQPVLVFVSRLEHGKVLQARLGESLGSSLIHFIRGSTPVKSRVELFGRFRSGDLAVLICMDKIGGQGIDLPSIERIIVAGGFAAPILVKQRVGRGMRRKPGAKPCYVYDFWDGHCRVLLRHSRARRDCYLEQGAEIVD